jgi:hypothetical protein
VRKSFSTWRSGIFAVLFPALLLLPFLHLHLAYEHAHGTDGTHTHQSVVHADFLPVSDHDHGEHHREPGVPSDTSSYPLAQISFPTLLPRSLVLSPPALQRILISLPVTVLLLSSPFSFHTWILTRDHAPPVQIFAFSPLSPRSPPHLA